MKNFRKFHALALVAAALLGYGALAPAQNTNANVKGTKHNLSATGPGSVKAATQNQICVFCHTPHAANATAPAPLWNRKIGGATNDTNTYAATYTPYTSNSLDAEDVLNNSPIGEPGGASKLCLSCHDGSIAIGTVANSPGSGTTGSIPMAAGVDKMPVGAGTTTGFTRNLGTDLRNDHPISFTFNDTLATRDGELRSPPYVTGGKTVVGVRSSGVKPMLPLDHEGKLQCTSCHDPHLTASKFLRLNRFQKNASAGTEFSPTNDQICLGCHDRNKDGEGNAYLAWSNSAHANSDVATYSYKGPAATQREFPDGGANGSPIIKVWEAGCLNCHDTHTVQGSRRLLREGTDSTTSPKAGGNPAIEETCYQCHTTTTASILTVTTMTASTGVPNIKDEFTRARRMPITGTEKHDIGGNFTDAGHVDCSGPSNKCGTDFIESREKLGAGVSTNRHVECTDCHNPHRVIKNALFNGTDADTRRTHKPGGANGNLASGALRGMWGVEPTWSASGDWPELPGAYEVKRGDPGANTATTKAQKFLTREYQLCLKCHSDYGFGLTPPATGYTGGSTSNSIGSNYTNIAAELSVNALDTPVSARDQGELGECGTNCTDDGTSIEPTGSFPGDTLSSEMTDLDNTTVTNHRSWHPLHYPTGRTFDERRISDTTSPNFRTPFKEAVGTQTMHCSDCHGHNATWTQDSGPNLATVQGPHGSSNDFILRGDWSTSTTIGGSGLCFNCHNPTAGTTGTGDNGSGRTSGFNNAGTNGGGGHANEHGGAPCMRCHVAVPHGWKNKALLVNLNCRGPEGGAAAGSCDPTSGYANYPSRNGRYTNGPYYVESFLRVRTWVPSGNWSESRCGRSGSDGTGEKWMNDGGYCN
ncbi:cytochrome c3 family protein [Aromatoleum evansii]|uniref:cytochrome c3 family protein n=1 Tax=Aromatoleum evansii TaxID=59406 RepID=UPI00145E36DB|nr:cytochrome c3 family protein [Aromatoleum evansii]NMG31971.1 hypothetical protein [Aromatoleum evansii]